MSPWFAELSAAEPEIAGRAAAAPTCGLAALQDQGRFVPRGHCRYRIHCRCRIQSRCRSRVRRSLPCSLLLLQLRDAFGQWTW